MKELKLEVGPAVATPRINYLPSEIPKDVKLRYDLKTKADKKKKDKNRKLTKLSRKARRKQRV